MLYQNKLQRVKIRFSIEHNHLSCNCKRRGFLNIFMANLQMQLKSFEKELAFLLSIRLVDLDM